MPKIILLLKNLDPMQIRHAKVKNEASNIFSLDRWFMLSANIVSILLLISKNDDQIDKKRPGQEQS